MFKTKKTGNNFLQGEIMKKYIVVILIVISAVVCVLCGFQKQTDYEYLRIHIRANSNLCIDQDVKYQIKDKLVNFLTPYLCECNDKESAVKTVNNNLENLEKIANQTLKQNGFDYTSKAKISKEYFPTRVYDGLVLESGNYDALVVELGKAQGDNWWCVVYPPLCFVSTSTKYVYKSKLLEIIKDFKQKYANSQG